MDCVLKDVLFGEGLKCVVLGQIMSRVKLLSLGRKQSFQFFSNSLTTIPWRISQPQSQQRSPDLQVPCFSPS